MAEKLSTVFGLTVDIVNLCQDLTPQSKIPCMSMNEFQLFSCFLCVFIVLYFMVNL